MIAQSMNLENRILDKCQVGSFYIEHHLYSCYLLLEILSKKQMHFFHASIYYKGM